jgi:hypothetical protein
VIRCLDLPEHMYISSGFLHCPTSRCTSEAASTQSTNVELLKSSQVSGSSRKGQKFPRRIRSSPKSGRSTERSDWVTLPIRARSTSSLSTRGYEPCGEQLRSRVAGCSSPEGEVCGACEFAINPIPPVALSAGRRRRPAGVGMSSLQASMQEPR